MDLKTKGIFATVIAAICFSIAGVFIKLLPLSPYTILFYRSLFCALFFLLVFGKKAFKFNRLSVIGAVVFYVPLMICFVMATKLTTAANAVFLQYAAPAFVLLFEPIFLKTKLLRINTLTVVLCISGMALFFMDDLEKPENWLGVGLAFASSIMLAGLIIIQKSNAAEYHIPTIMLGNILVVLLMAPLAIPQGVPGSLELTYLLILGFVQLGLGYVFYTYGQRHIPAIETALISMLEPILNPLWVMLGYGEKPGWWAIAGGCIIISALIIRTLVTHRQRIRSMAPGA